MSGHDPHGSHGGIHGHHGRHGAAAAASLPAEHGHADDWHQHGIGADVPQVEHGARLEPSKVVIGFILLVIAIVFSVTVSVLFYNSYMNDLKQERFELTSVGADARSARERTDVELNTYGIVDATTGTVRIPVDVAKERVLKKYGATK
jgi:hypothetical protein